MLLALTLAALAAAPAPDPAAALERQAARHVAQEYERVGRPAPALDPALNAAARALAREALAEGASGAVDLLSLTEAVSDAGAADPSPRSYVVRAWAHPHVVETFLARRDLADEPATHAGVGVALEGERAALVVLLAQRKARLQAVTRELAPGAAGQSVCGELTHGLGRAEVYVTRPGGQVDRVPLSRERGGAFCAAVRFPEAGTHTVEVIGRGPRGPEVAALFLVDVGERARGARERLEEPRTLPEARARILERINALRRVHQAPPLAADATLDRVAQAYSERMAREHFFAHVAPDGSDLRARLDASGTAFRAAGENLGLADGPLAAHFGIEHSPGHRKNLLDPAFGLAGLGVAFRTVDGRREALVTEVYAADVVASKDPLGDAYRALAEHRARHKLPRLERSPVLEDIAFSHAHAALRQDAPRAELPGSKLYDRVFAALPDVTSCAVDFFVTEAPGLLPDSRSLADRAQGLVGVAVVKGDSPTYGKGRYWVVVIYAARRPD